MATNREKIILGETDAALATLAGRIFEEDMSRMNEALDGRNGRAKVEIAPL